MDVEPRFHKPTCAEQGPLHIENASTYREVQRVAPVRQNRVIDDPMAVVSDHLPIGSLGVGQLRWRQWKHIATQQWARVVKAITVGSHQLKTTTETTRHIIHLPLVH